MMRCAASVVLTCLLLGGCSEPEQPQPIVQANLRGKVDASLPAAQKEKQTILKKVLDELQSGTSYQSLKEYHQNVRLVETQQQFLDGTIGLARWDFNGTPSGDNVPVVLYLVENTPQNPERKVERVYSVTGSAASYTIARKQ